MLHQRGIVVVVVVVVLLEVVMVAVVVVVVVVVGCGHSDIWIWLEPTVGTLSLTKGQVSGMMLRSHPAEGLLRMPGLIMASAVHQKAASALMNDSSCARVLAHSPQLEDVSEKVK